MTELLAKAFAEAARLPAQEQDELATWILGELESEGRWDAALTKSEDILARLADEALEEDTRGETEKMDPKKL